MRHPTITMLGIAAVLVLSGSAQTEVSIQGDVQISFGDNDQRVIREYYQPETIGQVSRRRAARRQGTRAWERPERPSPGLAKQGKLPPGIRKQLECGAILPPDVEKEAQPLPRELEARLTPLPSSDQVRVTIGPDILILDKQTKKVVDVMRDVVQLARDISK